MAWLRPFTLACTAAVLGCSDDGGPQGADATTETDGNGSTSGETADPTITTTVSASLTNGSSDTSNDDAADTGMATDASAGESTGAADDRADEDSSGGTAGGSTGATDPTGMDGSSSGDGGTTGAGTTPVGAECTEDSECTSGVCWDWSDYDPFCFGAVCSGECASDEECIALATDAAAPYPDAVYCGDDGLCVFLESGLGAWACQSPS